MPTQFTDNEIRKGLDLWIHTIRILGINGGRGFEIAEYREYGSNMPWQRYASGSVTQCRREQKTLIKSFKTAKKVFAE